MAQWQDTPPPRLAWLPQDLIIQLKHSAGTSEFEKTASTAKLVPKLLLFFTWRKKKKKKMWRNTKSQQHENASVFCKPVLLPWHFWSKSCRLTNHSLPSKEWVNTEPALWPAHSACHMNWQSESVTQSRLGWAGNPVCYNCSSFKWAHLNRAAALWTLRRYLRSARRQEVLARNLARPQLIFFTRAGATLLLSRLCFH